MRRQTSRVRMTAALGLLAAMLLPAALAGTASAQSGESGESGARIIGGSVVSPTTKYPFFVSVNPGNSLCGGTLIASTWVLTAAHCVDDAAPESIQTRIGVFNLDTASDGERRAVSRVLVHPEWNRPSRDQNDVALLQLASPSTRQTIGLARAGDASAWAPGSTVTVMGHGATAEGGNISTVLKELDVLIIDDATMQTPAFYGTRFVPSVMVGAGIVAGGEDSCQGDSGGPLITTQTPPRQVGVVSFGEGCARANKPGVYAKIGSGPLQSFIDSTLVAPASNLAPRFPASAPCGRIVAAPLLGGLELTIGAFDPEDEPNVPSSVEDVELTFDQLPTYATATQADAGDNTAIATIRVSPSIIDLLLGFFLGPQPVRITATDQAGARSTCTFQVRPTLFGAI